MKRMLWIVASCMAALSFTAFNAAGNPVPVTACCFPNGQCELIPEPECAAYGNVSMPGVYSCVPNPCPQPGACCLADGSCSVTLLSSCSEALGLWFGPITCSPNPCPPCLLPCAGACCIGEVCVFVYGSSLCEANGGQWLGLNVLCTPDPCSSTSGIKDVQLHIGSWGQIKSVYRR
jgi:hypothetical protein